MFRSHELRGERERERTCCKFQIDSSMHGMSLSFQFLPLLYPRNLWIFFIHENPTDHRHRTATLWEPCEGRQSKRKLELLLFLNTKILVIQRRRRPAGKRTRQHLTFLIVSSVASSYTDVRGRKKETTVLNASSVSIIIIAALGIHLTVAKHDTTVTTNATTNILQNALPKKIENL